MKQKIVVLTGAGVSAESGLKTFREQNGLWENHKVEEVATPLAWERNPELVLEFYNQRRKQLYKAEPNAAHKALVKLEEKFNTSIITQNIDDLHERAGSTDVLHLHGELKKARSTTNPNLVYDIQGWELKMGDLCEKGSQLRPHIVWFGESVPAFEQAAKAAAKADIFIIIGTSLLVYPAAGLINFVPNPAKKYIIDPNASNNLPYTNLTVIRKKAAEAMPELVENLINNDIYT